VQGRPEDEQKECKASCRGHDRSVIEAGEEVSVLVEASLSVEFPREEFMTRQFDIMVVVAA